MRHRIIVFVDATWTHLSLCCWIHTPAQSYCDSHVCVIDCSTGDQYHTVKAIALFTEITICSDKSYMKIIDPTHGKFIIVQHFKLNERGLCGITGDLLCQGHTNKLGQLKKIVELKVL